MCFGRPSKSKHTSYQQLYCFHVNCSAVLLYPISNSKVMIVSNARVVQFLSCTQCSRVSCYVMVVRAEALECGSWRPGAVPAWLPRNRWSLPRCSPPPPSPPPPPPAAAHHLPTFHIAHLHSSFLPSRSCPTSFSITCSAPTFPSQTFLLLPLAVITGYLAFLSSICPIFRLLLLPVQSHHIHHIIPIFLSLLESTSSPSYTSSTSSGPS